MTTEHKVIGGIALLTITILVGGVFFLSKDSSSSVPADQIVASSGLHWHPKLTITIKGKKEGFPANLGLGGAVHQKIHTHDTDAKDGVVHVEAKGIVTKDDTKLSNFFRVWGKDFNSTTILDKKNGQDGTVKMLVNGKESKDFENYLMKDGDNIDILYE